MSQTLAVLYAGLPICPWHIQQRGFMPGLWSSALAALSHTDLLCQKGTMHSSYPESIALQLNIELTCSSVKKILDETQPNTGEAVLNQHRVAGAEALSYPAPGSCIRLLVI